MAYLKPMRGKYYSIISIWNGVKQSSKTIPLKTKNKTDARLRHQIVEKYENDIKDDPEEYLKDAITNYLEQTDAEGVSSIYSPSIEVDNSQNLNMKDLEEIKKQITNFN